MPEPIRIVVTGDNQTAGTFSQVAGNIEAVGRSAASLASGGLAQMSSGFRSAGSEAQALGGNLRSSLSGAISSANAEARGASSIGRNLVQSIASGVSSGAGAIRSAVQSAVGSAVNAAKSELGIASPSKVGVGIGENFIGSVSRGAVKSAPATISNVRNIVNRISEESRRSLIGAATERPVTTINPVFENNITSDIDIVRFRHLLRQELKRYGRS